MVVAIIPSLTSTNRIFWRIDGLSFLRRRLDDTQDGSTYRLQATSELCHVNLVRP